MSKSKPEMVRPDSPMATSKLRLLASSAGYVRCSTSGFIGGSTCTWHGLRRTLSVTEFVSSSWQPINSCVWRHYYVIMTSNYDVILTWKLREHYTQLPCASNSRRCKKFKSREKKNKWNYCRLPTHAGHSIAFNMTLWPCGLDLWPFDLILNVYQRLMMDYGCGKFGDCSFSRFGFNTQRDRQTDRQTDRRRWTLYSRNCGRRDNANDDDGDRRIITNLQRIIMTYTKQLW